MHLAHELPITALWLLKREHELPMLHLGCPHKTTRFRSAFPFASDYPPFPNMATASTMVFAILLIGLTTFLVLLRKRRKYSDDVHLLPAPVRVPCVSYNPLYFAPYWKCVKTCRCPLLLIPDCDIYNFTLFIVVLCSVVVVPESFLLPPATSHGDESRISAIGIAGRLPLAVGSRKGTVRWLAARGV